MNDLEKIIKGVYPKGKGLEIHKEVTDKIQFYKEELSNDILNILDSYKEKLFDILFSYESLEFISFSIFVYFYLHFLKKISEEDVCYFPGEEGSWKYKTPVIIYEKTYDNNYKVIEPIIVRTNYEEIKFKILKTKNGNYKVIYEDEEILVILNGETKKTLSYFLLSNFLNFINIKKT